MEGHTTQRKPCPAPTPAPKSRNRERFAQSYLVRLRDFASAVGLSESAIRTEIRLGRIEARRNGRAVLIPRTELERWAASLPAA